MVVERADGSIDRYAFDGGSAPAVRITEGPLVPYLPPGMHLTQGRVEDYEARHVMMLSEHALQHLGVRPPRAQRRMLLKVDEKYMPRLGDDIGYVNFKPFKYIGLTCPVPGRERVHVFGLLDDVYVALTAILNVLYEEGSNRGSMCLYSRKYAHDALNRCSSRIVVQNTHESRYDTLMLLKLLGAIHKGARTQTFIRTTDIDALITHSGSVSQLDWRFVS